MNLLLQKLYGKTVAIVSNSIDFNEDLSEEIDSHDIVIRFNRFYNYKNGKVGKKINIVAMTFNPSWHYNRETVEILTEQESEIFIVKKPETYFSNNCLLHELLPRDAKVYNYSVFMDKYKWMTTGGALLAYLADNLKNAKVDVYGFDDDDSWERYVSAVVPHKIPVADKERKIVKESIKTLRSLTIDDKQDYNSLNEYKIVIPFKSSDFEGILTDEEYRNFNIKMVDTYLDEIMKLNIPITVVSNDLKLNQHIVSKYPYNIDIYDSFLPVDDTDITYILNEYCKLVNYDGNILVVMLDKMFDIDTIVKCKNALDSNVLVGTAIVIRNEKLSTYFIEDTLGHWVQLFKNFGPPSTPRVKLPKIYRFTGNVTAFHSDAIYYNTIFNIGRFFGILVNDK